LLRQLQRIVQRVIIYDNHLEQMRRILLFENAFEASRYVFGFVADGNYNRHKRLFRPSSPVPRPLSL
jgi:hypothetical protein